MGLHFAMAFVALFRVGVPIFLPPGMFEPVLLDWHPSVSADVSHYRVYRDDVLIGRTDATAYLDRVERFGTYTYAVTAVDEAGNESQPAVVSHWVRFQTIFREE